MAGASAGKSKFVSCFSAKLCETFCDITFLVRCSGRPNADIFKQTDPILFEQRDKSSQFNYTQYDVLPHDVEIRLQVAVTSLRPIYCDINFLVR